LNITIKYSQTEKGLVFNSRLWVLLSMLTRHPSHYYFFHFFCLPCVACACVGTCQPMVQRESLFFVITCETVGTVDWMCFPWKPRSEQG